MKNKIKLLVFPILTAVFGIALVVSFLGNNQKANPVEGENGVIYTEYFTGNAVSKDWSTNLNKSVVAPEVTKDSLHFSGSGVKPSAAMLEGVKLPKAFDVYFTADIAERGGDGRDSGIFFCVDNNYEERYQVIFSEETIRVKYNGTKDVAVKKVKGLKGGAAYGFQIKVNGSKMEVYFEGAEEPCLKMNASGEFASFEQARTFGVFSYARDFYFDNLVIANGKDFIPVEKVGIQGENGTKKIAGLGKTLQMQMLVHPSNATDMALVWSVDNTELAEISQDGLVTTKGYGDITVSARTRDGSNLVATEKIQIGIGEAEEEKQVMSTNRKALLASEYSLVCDGEKASVYVSETGRIFVASSNVVNYSEDGKKWKECLKGNFEAGTVFEVNESLYFMTADAENGKLVLYKSENKGDSWSDKFVLDGRKWHTSPSKALVQGDCIYLAMEVESANSIQKGYAGNAALAPIVMRAKLDADLTKADTWTFSSELAYADIMQGETADKVDFVDVPNNHDDTKTTGWAAGNLFQLYDEKQMWYDESMSSFFIYLHGNEGAQGYAMLLKVTEDVKGSMTPSLVETIAAKKKLMFVPMPGGNQEFGMIYDETSGLYWQVSNYLNEDNRVALYFSKNAYDWSFAGIVTKTADGSCIRPTLAVAGEDLVIMTIQDDGVACYRIADFRSLKY